MATTVDITSAPLFQENGTSQNAIEFRQLIAGLTGGTYGTVGCKVTEDASPDMTVDIETGHLFIPVLYSGGQGIWHVENISLVNLDVDTGDGGGDRKDTVIAYVQDDAIDSLSQNRCRLTVVKNPSTTTTRPSLTAYGNGSTGSGYVVLADIIVPQSESSSITDSDITDARRDGAQQLHGLGGGAVMDHAETSSLFNVASASETKVTPLEVTGYLLAGRNYRVRSICEVDNNSGSNQVVYLAMKDGSATQIDEKAQTLEGNQNVIYVLEAIVSPTADGTESFAIYLDAALSAGAHVEGTSNRHSFIELCDAGAWD